MPERAGHVDAAELRNRCRRAGIQPGAVDALFVQLGIRHDLTLLTMDGGFASAAKHANLEVWKPAIDPEWSRRPNAGQWEPQHGPASAFRMTVPVRTARTGA